MGVPTTFPHRVIVITSTLWVWSIVVILLTEAYGSVGLMVPLSAANPVDSLRGVTLARISDGVNVDLGNALLDDRIPSTTSDTSKSAPETTAATGKPSPQRTGSKTMVVLATHPADFNCVEYVQRLLFFWPRLQTEVGISRCLVVVNGQASSAQLLIKELGGGLLSDDGIEVFADPAGEAGRAFGVSRGWRPDDPSVPAFVKVTVVGLGFGPPWMTLPAVLPGYFGDPDGSRDWIEASLQQGQEAGRWPQVLELGDDDDDVKDTSQSKKKKILRNRFDDFPLIGRSWGRRPFELATLRLQNLIGIQIRHWENLKPVDDRCLTQLGGCAVVDAQNGQCLYSWVDRGLCDVADMEDILSIIST